MMLCSLNYARLLFPLGELKPPSPEVWLTLINSEGGGGAIIILCQKISLERNIRLTSNQAVNSSLDVL